MKTNTNFTIQLDREEMDFLRDLVRIGMKSKYYNNFKTEELDDYEMEDHRNKVILAAQQFVQLSPISQIETLFDDRLFDGVTV